MISRGEVYWASLQLSDGRIERKLVLVVSCNPVSRGLRPIVARISAEPRERNIPSFVTITREDITLPREESWILLHDLAVLPQDKLVEHVGTLGPWAMREVDDKLRFTFDLERRP